MEEDNENFIEENGEVFKKDSESIVETELENPKMGIQSNDKEVKRNLATATEEKIEEETSIQEDTTSTKEDKQLDTKNSYHYKKSPKIEKADTVNISYGEEKNRYGLPVLFDLIDKEKIKFNVEEASAKYVDLLLKENLLIINCAHDGITNSLKQTIAQDDNFKQYLKYEVSFDEYDRSDIKDLIEDCKKIILQKENKKLLLFIYNTKDTNPPKLLRSLKKENGNGKKDILTKLDNTICIIYITYHEHKNYLKGSCFDFHTIDTFQIYAATHKITEDQIYILESKRVENIWSKDDKEFLKDIDKIIEAPNFDQIIRDKKKETTTSFLSSLKNKNAPLSRYVLFIATLFPELSPDMFIEYLHILLKKRKKIKINGEKISLLNLWEEDSDLILDECNLETYRKDNQYFIDFKSSAENTERESFVFKELTFFAQRNARLLIDQQHLFTSKASLKLHYKMHPIIAKLAMQFKNYYGDELLKKWLLQLEDERKEILYIKKKFKKIKADRKGVIDKINELRLLKNIKDEEDKIKRLRKITPIRFRQQHDDLLDELQFMRFLFHKEEGIPESVSIEEILSGLYDLEETLLEQLHVTNNDHNKASNNLSRNVYLYVDLLSTIHEKDESDELISDFFTESLRLIYHHFILLDVITKFQIKNETFNTFEYYKQSLIHSNKNLNEIAITAFCDLLSAQSSDFYMYFSKIKDWFPENGKSFQEYTKLEKNVVIILFDVLTKQMTSDKRYEKNNTPLNSDTYKAIFQDRSKCKRYLNIVVSNMLNILLISEEEKEYVFKKIQNQLTELIVFWYQILKKIQELNISNTTIEEEIQFLIDIILNTLRKDQLKKIKTGLERNRSFLNKQIIAIKDFSEKQQLKKERDSLIQFINLLNN
ncbi:hypothetical protein KORDIASMS9_04666 [Kordia sp. SMS9]|uniref:hypothetical protein n=1 Tax=Kordia sp. SMS9 TaxID=2282170 RepID=UPI000E0D7516|nr:hypothetical protein [Kordia sp. SMS9]AXG72394.1 hypothetical protein KORDIASMS9_04666 [Kordia sp. SMS9]